MEPKLNFVGGTGHNKLGALPTVPARREQRESKGWRPAPRKPPSIPDLPAHPGT